MPSTKDIGLNPTPSILIVGDSGTHKTYLAGSFPSPHISDFDKRLQVLRGKAVDYDTFRDAPPEAKGSKTKPMTDPKVGIYPFGKSWPAFKERINVIGQQIDNGDCPYQTLVCDSITHMGLSLQNHIMRENGHDTMTQPDWGQFIQEMLYVVGQITAWPLIKIFTAHIERTVNDATQATEMLPLIQTKKLPPILVSFFDEVWFTEAKKDANGKDIFNLITSQRGMFKSAKSSCGVPDGTVAEWSAVKPYVLGEK